MAKIISYEVFIDANELTSIIPNQLYIVFQWVIL